MGCPIQTKDGAELILDYCAGRLTRERAEAVEAHARVCATCREMIDAQRAVWQALEHWDAPAVSGHFDRELYARIDAEEHSSGAVIKWARAAAARWPPFSWRMPIDRLFRDCVPHVPRQGWRGLGRTRMRCSRHAGVSRACFRAHRRRRSASTPAQQIDHFVVK